MEVSVVGGGAREGMVSTKEVGRDRKRQDNDGNYNINRTNRVTGPSPVAGGSIAIAEQSANRSTTPGQGQGQPQRSKAQQEKPFSYAQALKTKSSPFSKPPSEGGVCRAPSSKLSSRSQTPSESSLLGGKEGVMVMKGAPPHGHGSGGNHTSIEDSLDFELRSSSALSITTATDSVTSERSASRQSLSVDTSQRGEEELKVAFDTRAEKSDYDDSEGITFMGPQLDYEQAERSPIAPPPLIASDPSPPTNQFRAPSPAARSASPVNTTITVNHPSATEYANQHPGQRSAPPTQSTQQSPNQEDKAATFIEGRVPHSPTALSPVPPPGLSPNKEHPYKSSGTSPQHPSVAGEADPSIGAQAQAFKALQQLEPTPPPSGLGDDETDGSEKNRQPPEQAAAILLPPSQKQPALDDSKEGVQSLMLPLPGGQPPQQQQDISGSGGPGGTGVLPSPATPHIMTSILPHPPPNSQMGFATTPPQQAHLPLRPPGQSGNSG